MRDPHDRRCFQCGHVQHCIDRVIPEVTCRNCGSNDTRAIVPPATELPATNEETYDAESDLRSEIETAIERAASGVHDSTQWWDNWNKDKQGRRIIEQVIDEVVSAAKTFADDRSDGMNELFADIRKVVGGNSNASETKPYNYTLPWLPHSLMLRIDAAMNQEHRG